MLLWEFCIPAKLNASLGVLHPSQATDNHCRRACGVRTAHEGPKHSTAVLLHSVQPPTYWQNLSSTRATASSSTARPAVSSGSLHSPGGLLEPDGLCGLSDVWYGQIATRLVHATDIVRV